MLSNKAKNTTKINSIQAIDELSVIVIEDDTKVNEVKDIIQKLDYYEDNALREIELYFYRIYGIPKKPTFKDKLIKFIKEFFNVPGINKKILFGKRAGRRL